MQRGKQFSPDQQSRSQPWQKYFVFLTFCYQCVAFEHFLNYYLRLASGINWFFVSIEKNYLPEEEFRSKYSIFRCQVSWQIAKVEIVQKKELFEKRKPRVILNLTLISSAPTSIIIGDVPIHILSTPCPSAAYLSLHIINFFTRSARRSYTSINTDFQLQAAFAMLCQVAGSRGGQEVCRHNKSVWCDVEPSSIEFSNNRRSVLLRK